jgi:hypothetical protein
MVWPMSNEAQNAIGGSFAMDVRCTVYSPVYGELRYLPISGGSVDADAGSQVRRTGTIQAEPRFWKKSPGELLSPYGSAIQIEYGIGLPSGDFEYIPLAYLAIDEASRARPVEGSADIPLKLVDRSARVAEDKFDGPTQTVAGATAVAEIIRLVRQTLGPDIQLVDRTGSTQIVPVMDIESARWADGVEKLADAIGGEAFFDQIGRVVVRPQPTLTDAAVWSVTTGRGGNKLTVVDVLSRELAFNKWVVTGERSDGADPVIGVAIDDDPASPTFYGGPFGKKSRQTSSPLLTTNGQCVTAAIAQREASRGTAASISMTITPNPGLEPGDVFADYDTESGDGLHIIDKLSMPLSPVDPQPITTRAITLPAAS